MDRKYDGPIFTGQDFGYMTRSRIPEYKGNGVVKKPLVKRVSKKERRRALNTDKA